MRRIFLHLLRVWRKLIGKLEKVRLSPVNATPRRLARTRTLAAGALALACAGLPSCGTATDPVRGAPDGGSQSFARVAVVLTAPREGSVTIGALGRLLRYRGVDLDSAQVLAGVRDRDRASLGRCSVIDEETQLEDTLASSPPEAAV